MKRRLKLVLRYVPMLPLLLLAVFFLLVPLGSMLIKSFLLSGGAFTLGHYKDIFSKEMYLAAVRNSLWLALTSSLWGIVISFFAALSLAEISAKSRSRFLSILSMASNFVAMPLSFAFMVLLGSTGVIMEIASRLNFPLSKIYNLYSGNGLLLVYIDFQISLGTLLLFPAFQGIRKEWKEAAALMRASGMQFWAYIGIPMLVPSLADTFAMLFANAFTAYATAYVIVATNYPLLSIKIAAMYTGEAVPQPNLGAALSIVLLMIILIVIGVCNFVKTRFYKGGNA